VVVVVEMAAAAPASRKSELLVQKIASSQAKAGEGQIGTRCIQGPTSRWCLGESWQPLNVEHRGDQVSIVTVHHCAHTRGGTMISATLRR
jgi:hypothetical protein